MCIRDRDWNITEALALFADGADLSQADKAFGEWKQEVYERACAECRERQRDAHQEGARLEAEQRERELQAACLLVTDDHIRGWYQRTYGMRVEQDRGPQWNSPASRRDIVADMTSPEREDRYEVSLACASDKEPRHVHGHPTWDQNYLDMIRRLSEGHGEGYEFRTHDAGVAQVALLTDTSAEQDILNERYDGDLMDGCPTIRVMLGGKVSYLTWAEAYNLGQALIRTANVAHYG